LLALKGNQGHLHEEVRAFMETLAKTENPHDETVEKDHGRIETRRVWVSDRVDWINARSTFPGLKTLVLVEALREMGGKSTVERRCYLSSLPPEAKPRPPTATLSTYPSSTFLPFPPLHSAIALPQSMRAIY
jgi:hypothetical protein